MGIFLASSWVCAQSRKKHWPRCVKISCQKVSAPRKSPKGWPLTFWPKVRHVAPSFHLPLEYEVRSLYMTTFIAIALEIMVCLWVIMTLTFKRVTRNSMCVFLSCCSTKPNMFFSTINQKYGRTFAYLIKGFFISIENNGVTQLAWERKWRHVHISLFWTINVGYICSLKLIQ